METIRRLGASGSGLLVAAVATLGSGCGKGDEPHAYGNFEATEVVVSAETSGQLLSFTAEEGQRLETGVLVAVIDTTQLVLERAQAGARRQATVSRATAIASEIEALRAQHEIAEREHARTRRLVDSKAATAQQLDRTENDYRVLGEQIKVTKAEQQALQRDIESDVASLALIDDRIRKSRIVNPRAGTVLSTYAESGEFVQQGQPLFRIADLRSMELRAYITEPLLTQVQIGQSVEISVDAGPGKRQTLPGVVTWISSEAEFTPTPIQTREERGDLVYAVKIDVPNPEGLVKIGMPADVRFSSSGRTP
jgi:HlyD family secretion protein